MMLGKINGYRVGAVKKNILEKEEFKEFLKKSDDMGSNAENYKALLEDIRETLDNKGKVYGIYKDKAIVGVYVFKRIKDYFIVSNGTQSEVNNQDNKKGLDNENCQDNQSGLDNRDAQSTQKGTVKVAGKSFDMDKFWYGESRDAYKLVHMVVSEELGSNLENVEKMEGCLKDDLRDQIDLGSIAGVEWKDILLYRKTLKKEKNGSFPALWLAGFSVGFVLGWLCFDNIALGICFGASYAVLFGGGALASATKNEWREFDFVNPEVKEEKENAIV